MTDFKDTLNLKHTSTYNSREHAILQVVLDISCSFKKVDYTLGISIDLPKVFDTVIHKIVISKLKLYDIKRLTLKYLKSSLSAGMHNISFSDVKRKN